MSELELRHMFEFDESDLATNRAGGLSPKQKKMLVNLDRGGRRFYNGLGIFFILLGILVNSLFINSAYPAGVSFENVFGGNSSPMFFIAPVCFPWVILGTFAYFSLWMGAKKTDHSMSKVEGRVHFVKVEKSESYTTASGSSSTRKTQRLELRIGGVTFDDFSSDLMNYMEEGNVYIIYYVKSMRHILSCEFVSKGK